MKLKISILVLHFFSIFVLTTEAQDNEIADKRMAAHHYSVVVTGTEMPSSAVLTYPVDEFRVQDYNFLLKLMPCIEADGKIIYPSDYDKVDVKDFPGGVEAAFSYRETQIKTRIIPLLTGRDSKSWDGAVLYEVETNNPEKDVLIYLGGASTINLIWGFESSVMKNDTVYPLANPEFTGNSRLKYTGGKEKLNMGIKTSGKIEPIQPGNHSSHARVRISDGKGHIFTAFSNDKKQLSQLMKMNEKKEKTKFNNYYTNLLKSSIVTPDTTMNQAFTSAIYNLEYSWLEPFGWGECLHHWLAMWYMQVTAAADWLGQTDRSRSSILIHGREQFESGAIPMFNPNHLTLGMKRRDWGGANNFWLWQIEHYMNYTGDKEFAREIIPYVDRTIQQTLDEYDPDGNQLIAWGLQIGNQEDFVANPYNGSVPSIELHNMFLTRSKLAAFINDTTTAKRWSARAEEVKKVLYNELWLNDLGRYAFYKDPTGRILPDGQYQTYLYPIIYNMVDPYDQYSSLRHLMDRLMDNDGAIFASNNFAFHVPDNVSTWGMQRGAAQQPWAAMGFSKTGLNNRTWLPLRAMAKWAQDPRRPGAWPETGPEITPAYFTPPAGLYISTTIENLFGLRVFEPEQYIEVSPSFPDHWPEAKLNLPDFQANYSKKGNRISYEITTSKDLPLHIRWRLPVSRIIKCTINGKPANYETLPGVGHIILSTEAPVAGKTTINFEFDPVDIEMSAPASIAEGELLDINLRGATINTITDRNGVLEGNYLLKPDQFTGRIKENLLDPYLEYNQLGQLNFSRRTFFLNCISPEGVEFIQPVDLAILPRTNSAVRKNVTLNNQKLIIPVTIRNNSSEKIAGDALIRFEDNHSLMPVSLAARSEINIDIELPYDPALPVGDNSLSLILPGEDPMKVEFAIPDKRINPEFISVNLPPESLFPDTLWNNLRVMPGFPHIFFTFSDARMPEPMWDLEGNKKIEVPQIEGLSFVLPGRHFIPVSHKSGQTSFKLDLPKHKYKKIYLLLIPFVDNHDIFSEVARVSLYAGNTAVQSRTLNYPGDVDYWIPNRNPTSFSTYREPRDNRFELLPMLEKSQGDWAEGKPPAFPQSRWWSTSHVIETESCLMNVVEINLANPMKLDYLILESLGALPAFGLVSVSAEINEE